ncbi:50S ribosomal protein L7/L12 [Spiroplasma citri]|uniref:Large ribosomal subunit protein bL12 n=1 Tax=Spiroplasma citri TaxID=2133 RepID=Q14QM9_SPICI|nr:50S ribosomal protein L7/L12 [Spiroplasma citri]APE75753.1 50S ribosomal protein L7/L12 [Spiroplasma citri]QED25508.1 50S ribosomal protein L7/L12 [Spiroplasma citri]QIA67909.1 50S ribosomal protein L7/L12 [Spiroplasma citri]QIA69766.1 50S ribosomal protein L7/L12 [Spiroplasma citri]QIA71638.1 50S ribosomal protein L7/L12 [Spiroplasma citri]
MALSKDDIIKALEEMKLSDLNELVKAIEDHFGVVAAAAVAAAPVEGSAAAGPSEVNIVLTDTGPSKVAIIKLVKEITGKELMAAKAIVDKLPAVIKEKVKVEEAEEIKGQLVSSGASVDLK